MRKRHWTLIFVVCALVGVSIGYLATLLLRPALIPPALRIGGVREPTNILVMGTDVVYLKSGRRREIDRKSFAGRSDTIMLVRLDPYKNSFSVLSIPRDTRVRIAGHGRQKINAANTLGGPQLAVQTVSELLKIPVNHYLLLRLDGLGKMVDEIGGVEINIPKRMRYRDRAAGLDIDLEPGLQNLDGKQCMGFVRFRHDELGDIGRVQRQELFIRAVLDKAVNPEAWTHLPDLLSIAIDSMDTDLTAGDITLMASFVKGVPVRNQTLVMLPGRFSESGDWLVTPPETDKIVAKLVGASFVETERKRLPVTITNRSSDRKLASRLYKILREKGYRRVRIKRSKSKLDSIETSQIIAQKGNPDEARLVRSDLDGIGRIVNASVGDIETSVTIVAGDDLMKAIVNDE